MPDGRLDSGAPLFAARTVVVSLFAAIPLLVLAWEARSPMLVRLATYLLSTVPVASMIVAAVGSPVERKMRYLLGLSVAILGFYLASVLTGWEALALRAGETGSATYAPAAVAFKVIWLGAPVAVLILFAGKEPSVFWRRGAAQPPGDAQGLSRRRAS